MKVYNKIFILVRSVVITLLLTTCVEKFDLPAGSYSDFKAYHVERNRIFLCLKYFPVWRLAASFFVAAYRYGYQIWLARTGRGTLGRDREDYSMLQGARPLVRAHWDAFGMAPVMLRRRREYRAIRRLSNKEVDRLFERYGIPTRELARYE